MTTEFDRKKFRAALGHYATGVAIVCAQVENRPPVGMTINSFASVSLDPPLVLWSVQSDSPSAAAFLAAPGFSISILGAAQEALAMRFSRTDASKFDGVPTRTGRTGVPIVIGGIAEFECTMEKIITAGDHDIMIGRVIDFTAIGGVALGFHAGRFTHFDAQG